MSNNMVPESISPNDSLNLASIPALSSSDLDNSLGTADINNKSAGSESVSLNFDSAINSDSVDTLNGKDKDVDNAVAEFILGTEKIDLLPNTPATSSQDLNNAEVDSGEVLPETQPLKTPTIPDNYSKLNTFGETDYFNVSQSGKAEIESGYYEALSKGELAIFSLEGMDKFKAGSVEFIAEAARRAASNSHLGYVVISEATEEHNLSASAGEKTNSKSGKGKKIRTYCMPAGSQFGVMLVPNGTVGEVLANSEIESGKRPLFGRQIIEYLNTPYLEATISEGVSIAEANLLEIMPGELSKTGSETVEEITQKTEITNDEKVLGGDNLGETTKAEFQSVDESPVIPTSEILGKENDINCTEGDNKFNPIENGDLSEKKDGESALSCNASPKDLQFSTQHFYKRGDVFQLTGKVFDLNGVDDIETLKISISKQMENGKWKTIEVTELREFKEDNEWANFSYELPNLEPGKYQVKLIARDEAGAVSNHAINEFTFLSSSETNNLTDSVLFAIDNATNLGSYTAEELAETKQWLVSVQEGESAPDLAALMGATNLGETGLIPNTYIFEFPANIEPTEIISELQSQLEVEYFYPLTWFNLKTYVPPSSFNTNDTLVSEQWHLNNTGQTGGTISADVNGFPAWNISLPGNLTQTVSGANINLGIVDDGVQQSHPDILQRYVEQLSHNFNIEVQNAPQSLNASQIEIEPRRFIDETSVTSTGEIIIESVQEIWRPQPTDQNYLLVSGDSNQSTLGITYGIEELAVKRKNNPNDGSSSPILNPSEIQGQAEILYGIDELAVTYRKGKNSPNDVNDPINPGDSDTEFIAAMLGYNGLETLAAKRKNSPNDQDSQEPDNSPDMAVVAVSGDINSLESLAQRKKNTPNDEEYDLTKIDTDKEAALIIESALQEVFKQWNILPKNPLDNSNDVALRLQPKTEENTEPQSFITGTDTANIVSEILTNNPAEIWVYGKPKNGDADSVVLISGKDSAAVADSILKHDLAQISVWWNPAPNRQPIEDPSIVFDRVWTGGNADEASVRSGETFVEIGTILGRENLEKLWERWNDDNSGSATNQIPNRHGTSVAGVAAASANETGIMGAAYEAGIANVQLLGDHLVTDKQIADALIYQNQAIDVYNNSWKPGDPFVGSPLVNWAFENNVNNGRNGLGNITVFAGGNDGWDGGNVNYNSFANSRNTIAVAAIDHNGEQSWYGEPGSSLLVSAYSSGDGVGITTTAASNDGNAAYTDSFGGTSSAAPLVSGVVALMLQANPNLTQRDVQHILVETAEKNDATDENWVVNAAGYEVNYKYGFGGINAEAAVKTAISWNGVSPEIEVESPVQHVGISIPDNNSAGVVSEIRIERDIKVEWAEVMLDIDHSWRGDLEVKLISPSGTESILAEPHYDPEDGYKWVFTSNRNWGESSLGDWKLEVSDRLSGEAGVLNNWKLNLYGTEQVIPGDNSKNIVNISTTDVDAGEDGNTGTFTITRTGDTTGTLTVNYAVAGKAKFGSDYLGLTGSVTFDAGVTSMPLNIIPIDDNLDEDDEIIEVILGANSAYKVGTNNIADLTIKDNDDPTITITATDANATEDGNAAQFVVTRTGPDFSNPITVHYSLAGIATNGTDYRQLTGTVIIPAGMSSATIPVNPIFDYNVEDDETVTLNLIDTSFYNLGTSAGATATITNSTTTDWYGPFVYENPANGHLYILSQPDTWLGAQNQAQILGGNLVTINDAAEQNWINQTFNSQPFWMGMTDSEIYGKQPGNYQWVSGEPVTYTNWLPGSPSNSVWGNQTENFGELNREIVGSWNDLTDNWLSQPGIIEIDPTTLRKPIVNFMVTDSQAGENGNAGQLIISRVGKLDEALTVNYTVAGTATNGSDYEELTGTVTIPVGSSLVTIPILALNDNDVEGNEQIVVNLAAGNYQIGNKPVAQVTIADDDSGIFPVNNTPTLNPSASLTNATESAPYIITYETLLSATNAIDTDGDTLTFRIESVGADIPTKNGQPVVAGVTTLSPGESLVWTPTTAGAQMQAFSVSVSDGVGANPEWLPVSTPIAIDVFKPVVSITASDPNSTEGGDSGEFTITRTGDTTNPLTVSYSLDNNGFWAYPVATNGSDYETLSGTITIPAGASSVKIPINVIDDDVVEWPERVKLFVTGTDNYQVGNNANAEVKISDNETPLIQLYVEQFGVYDATEGVQTGRFLVRRIGSLLEPLTVNYSVAGTATPGTDYTTVGFNESTQTGSITIPAGQHDVYIQLNPIDDTEQETVETIDVSLTPNSNYNIWAERGTRTINVHDNENKSIFNVNATDSTATEGSDSGQYTITRTGDLSQTVTLKYNMGGDWSNSTNNGIDYEFVPNSITFAPNQTTATITINPIDDNLAEVTESVVINLIRDPAYLVGDNGDRRLLIYDNERPEIEWQQQLGTSADDTVNAIAINNGNLSFATNGELIGTGGDDNIDIAFDNFGNWYNLSKGDSLTYLSKYNSGGGVEWQQSFGVNSEMTKLAVTPDGSVYITGSTTDNLDGINAGKLDAWIAKFDSTGTQEWVKQIGTPDDEKATGIAIDNQGNVYITGTTKGGLGGTREGDGDAWVAKYNSSGSLQWTEQIGSIAEDISYGIATDNNGHIYVAGKTYGWLGENYTGGPRNWVGDATARYEAIIGNSYGLGGIYYGSGDAWVAQLSTDGDVNWKRLLGTTGEDSANSIVADNTGVYLTGTTTGKLGDTQFGGQDIFYAKYNVAGALQWKQQLGTTADDVANDIVLDGNGLIIAGETSGNLEGTNQGGEDAFVIKLS
ncbi:S8 family serine peptidase [Ancylothrix sp. C2]|uniref:Calx-beta domain-containing protein n=1 Tax=Ancylothrix sp. D3o TaxID=2953691 RepID=UPI0021BBA20F|nr:Calx-beta domain-containing protein [Ancylothrix sp. D3o]MCT7952729.1 S8 family serine peptidase [Ancylothrix sp. D3o]